MITSGGLGLLEPPTQALSEGQAREAHPGTERSIHSPDRAAGATLCSAAVARHRLRDALGWGQAGPERTAPPVPLTHFVRPTLSTVNFKESGFKSTDSKNGRLPPCLLKFSNLCLVWEFRQIFRAGEAERAEVERDEIRRKVLRWQRCGDSEQEPRQAGRWHAGLHCGRGTKRPECNV